MDTNKAKFVLESFISEMRLWEIKWGKVFDEGNQAIFSDDNLNLRRTELLMVYNKYLSEKVLSLEQSRTMALSFSMPPEYNQEIYKEDTSNQIQISFEVNKNGDKYRIYYLIFEKNLWKIDKMKISELNWKMSRQLF